MSSYEHMFASILHADADSFFASVEQRDDPALRGRPVIVGMGVVLAASYEAKAYGVYTPMGGRQALRLCPQAVVVPPRMSAYTEASKALYAVFEETTPLVEGLSIDEAFLDVRGMERSVGHAARDRPPAAQLGARARRDPRHGRNRPHEVPRQGRERSGEARRASARAARAASAPSCTRCPSRRCGASGRRPPRSSGAAASRRSATWRACPRVRSRRCSAGRPAATCTRSRTSATRGGCVMRPRRRSIGSQHARGRGRRSPEEVDADLVAIVERVMRRVRAAHRVGRTVVLRLRFDDFSRATRSCTLFAPDGAHLGRPRRRARPARGGAAADRPARPDADRDLAREPRRRPAVPARAAVRSGRRGACSTRRWTRSATASAQTAVTRAVLLGRSALSMPLLPD